MQQIPTDPALADTILAVDMFINALARALHHTNSPLRDDLVAALASSVSYCDQAETDVELDGVRGHLVSWLGLLRGA